MVKADGLRSEKARYRVPWGSSFPTYSMNVMSIDCTHDTSNFIYTAKAWWSDVASIQNKTQLKLKKMYFVVFFDLSNSKIIIWSRTPCIETSENRKKLKFVWTIATYKYVDVENQWEMSYVCVCVCVWKRERERKKERLQRETVSVYWLWRLQTCLFES